MDYEKEKRRLYGGPSKIKKEAKPAPGVSQELHRSMVKENEAKKRAATDHLPR